MRQTLCTAYLDYVNNYLSTEIYAERNELTSEQAEAFIDLARTVYYSAHPDR